MMVEDEVAQKLEAAGLWRRAASRWLEVMKLYALTDNQREWIRQRRKYCLSSVVSVVLVERLDIAAIAKAAKATQERMGLSQPNGAAFRLKDKDFNRRADTQEACAPSDVCVFSDCEDTTGESIAHTCGIDVSPDNNVYE